MAEQHRDKLCPAFKATGVAVGSMFPHRGFKFQPREQPQKLRKNTAYSTHGRKPPFSQIGSSQGTQPKLTALPPFAHKLIWTSLGRARLLRLRRSLAFRAAHFPLVHSEVMRDLVPNGIGYR